MERPAWRWARLRGRIRSQTLFDMLDSLEKNAFTLNGAAPKAPPPV
jgi:hypothetical protein